MKEAIAKSEVLLEALPYIQAFRGKKFVIKIGGEPVDEPEVLDALLRDVVFLSAVGIAPIVVHGGGKEISREMERRGIKPRFVEGLRYTDEAVMDVVRSVLGDTINGRIADRIRSFGGRARSGRGQILTGRRVEVKGKDLGLVGEVVGADVEILEWMCSTHTVPVIAPVAIADDRTSLNVNGDTAAAGLARILKAEKIIFLTTTPGILAAPPQPESLIPSLDREGVRRRIEDGTITGGMLPKVRACLDALSGGVRKAHIISATLTHSLLLEIFTSEGIGTEILGGD